jgi:LysR family transcriptional regulator, glycine cleavage system transcriptional activator
MLKKIGSLNSLRNFEVAGRRMSFTRATEELHITQGAVSYQIRELESRLGIKLFHREISKVTLTNVLLRPVESAAESRHSTSVFQCPIAYEK